MSTKEHFALKQDLYDATGNFKEYVHNMYHHACDAETVEVVYENLDADQATAVREWSRMKREHEEALSLSLSDCGRARGICHVCEAEQRFFDGGSGLTPRTKAVVERNYWEYINRLYDRESAVGDRIESCSSKNGDG